jgi:hypothetical protein
LIRIECTETQAAFRRAIEDVLSDRPRSGNPGKGWTNRARKLSPCLRSNDFWY